MENEKIVKALSPFELQSNYDAQCKNERGKFFAPNALRRFSTIWKIWRMISAIKILKFWM